MSNFVHSTYDLMCYLICQQQLWVLPLNRLLPIVTTNLAQSNGFIVR